MKSIHRGIAMHWMTYLGIILIAVGTILSILGQSRSTRDDVRSEISDFSKRIEEVKKETSSESHEKVQKIENEFNRWADDFLSKKGSWKLEIQKDDLLVREQAIKLNEKYGNVYTFFFGSLRQFIDAYNSKAKEKLTYDIKDFPDDLFSEKASRYMAKVKFQDNVVWKFKISVRRPHDKEPLPYINLYVDNTFEDNEKSPLLPIYSEVGFVFALDVGKIIITRQDSVLRVTSLKDKYDLDSYQNSIKEILKTLIEYQIAKIQE